MEESLPNTSSSSPSLVPVNAPSNSSRLNQPAPKFLYVLLVLLLLIMVGAGAFYFGQNTGIYNMALPSPQAEVSTAPVVQDERAGWKKYTFEEIGLTFSAPDNLTVTFESQKNPETGIPYSYTLYVQNNSQNIDDYYQLYGIYQLDSSHTNASLEEYKADLQPESIKDRQIGGFPALEGQIKGERNRFVTYIATDKGVFSLFTAQPTLINKDLTDKILSTFQFALAQQTNATNCLNGYKIFNSKLFSVCYPEDMTFTVTNFEPHDVSEKTGISINFTNTAQTLIVGSDFQGGWGNSPCATIEDTQLLGFPSQRLNWKQENGTDCGTGYTNFVTLINNKEYTNHYPYIIDFRATSGTFADDSIMKIIEQSFKLKQ